MSTTDEKRLATIAAILNKAENTDNEAEKDTYFSAAQNMATKHGIDLAIARQHTRSGEKSKQNEVQVARIEIGRKGDRGSGTYSDLLISIADANEILWVRDLGNTWVELYGMKFDIEYAQNLYAVLLVQMVTECNEFLTEGTWREHGDSRMDAKISFCSAFMGQIKHRLTQARLDAEREAQSKHTDDGVSVALVLADQRREIRGKYYEKRRGIGTYRLPSGRNHAGHRKGHEAGNNANLHNRDEIDSRKSIG